MGEYMRVRITRMALLCFVFFGLRLYTLCVFGKPHTIPANI